MNNDYITMAGTKAKGKRPQFLESSETERLMSILMAVAGELAVTRERLDTVERILESKGIMNAQDIESFEPSKEQAEERAVMQQEYIARILRIVQQEKESLEQQARDNSDNSLNEIEAELATI